MYVSNCPKKGYSNVTKFLIPILWRVIGSLSKNSIVLRTYVAKEALAKAAADPPRHQLRLIVPLAVNPGCLVPRCHPVCPP